MYVQAKESEDGLEAFRHAHANLTKLRGQQRLDEYKCLDAPHGRKTATDIDTLRVSLDNRARALETINSNYAIGRATKRNVAYGAMRDTDRTMSDNKFADTQHESQA